MKKILCVVMFVALCSFFAFGQGRAPMMTLNHGNVAHHGNNFAPGGAPALCQGKCPFYGGDIDVNDPNVNGFANANTLLVSDTHTYSVLKAPVNAQVTGMVINHLPTASGNIYDPAVGQWDVRTGVSSGNGGTSVASGQNKLAHQPTGRTAFGLTEDSAGSLFTSPVSIASGTSYWFNYTPQCTNSGNSTCSAVYYFESNTDSLNSVNGNLQPKYEIFFTSSYFGYNWANLCGITGTQNSGCQGMSYALAGHQ